MLILAIDLSSYGQTSVSCRFDTETKEHMFGRVATTRDALVALAQEVKPDEIVIEACGVAYVMHRALTAAGSWRVLVANVNEEPWRWRATKRKTDRDDALRLAKLAAAGDIVPVHLPPERVRQWRLLIAYRARLVQRRTAIRNQIRSVLDREGIIWPPAWQGWTRAAREALARLVAAPDGSDPLEQMWRFHLASEIAQHAAVEGAIDTAERELARFTASDERVALLRTIPGVGARCAEALVSYFDDPKRFANGKQVGNSLGFTPRLYQSGEMERLCRISKRGNSLVRTILVEVCWLGRRINPWLERIFQSVHRGSAVRRKVAIIACARRLAICAWAMLRDHKPWDPAAMLGGDPQAA
jgi:transposase